MFSYLQLWKRLKVSELKFWLFIQVLEILRDQLRAQLSVSLMNSSDDKHTNLEVFRSKNAGLFDHS